MMSDVQGPKVVRPRCPNCGWPFFTDAVNMEGSENPLAMCTRCYAVMEVTDGERNLDAGSEGHA
jgi:hypothetical protein